MFDRLRAAAQEALGRHAVPGMALGVLHEGQEHYAAWGTTSVENGLAVDADTLFLVASNTKTFTGTVVMRLVEQGKLDLDAPLSRYVPELRLSDPAAAERATLRLCLTHRGGWEGDHLPDTGRGDDALARAVASMAELKQHTPPGEVWSYNNAGFMLAGRAIETATGMPYEAAVRELLLEPVGMTRSTFFADEAIAERVSAGHNVIGGTPHVVRPWSFPRTSNAMGGLISSAREMLRWGRFNLGDGDGVLRPETMRLMRERQCEAGGLADEIGITWMRFRVGGDWVYGHGGYAPGQMSAFRFLPERGLALIVLTNSDHGSRAHGEVVSAAYRIYLGAEPARPATVQVPAEKLREYAGLYRAALDDVELTVQDGELHLRTTELRWLTPSLPKRESPPPTRLAFHADDRVVALDPPHAGTQAEFLRAPDGRIAWLRWGGRIHGRS